MAEQMRPASKEQAPDPANSYERADPDREAGMGRLDNNAAVPQESADKQQDAVHNKQDPHRQLNAQDVVNQRGGAVEGQAPARTSAAGAGGAAPEQPDHSMLEEEPDGWDQAPTDIDDKRMKRHPRTEGRGGTP